MIEDDLRLNLPLAIHLFAVVEAKTVDALKESVVKLKEKGMFDEPDKIS